MAFAAGQAAGIAQQASLRQRVAAYTQRAAGKNSRSVTVMAGTGRFFVGGELAAEGDSPGWGGSAAFVGGAARRKPEPAPLRWVPSHRCARPAGNWKCNGTVESVAQLVQELNAGARRCLALPPPRRHRSVP